jgi:hypothetical protein
LTEGRGLDELVEVQSGIIERPAIHRDTSGNVRELTSATKAFVDGRHPWRTAVVWNKTPGRIHAKAHRQTTQTRAS